MRKFCILVLEDTVVTSVALSRSLELEFPDASVIRAQSLFEARLLLKTYDVHFFVVDIQLPDGSGIDFLPDIASKNPKAAVVIVTASPLPKYRDKASEFGVLHFMEKPVDIPLLHRLARECRGALAAVDTSFSASLKKLSAMDVVQLKCLARATVRLDFTNRDLGLGRIFIQDGEFTHAEVMAHPGAAPSVGESALNQILAWKGGKVEEATGALAPARTIHGGWQALVLNAAQWVDERGSGRPPS